jgi:RNA polymerase sigma-70 factor (ECF subfamily)
MARASDRANRHIRLVGPRELPTGEAADVDADADADEIALVAAFQMDASNASASAALWDRYYPLVRRVLCRAIGPGQDVEDLVQEVFLRLYRKLPGLRDPASLRSFVLAITARVLQGELRTRWLRRWLRLGNDEDALEQPATDVDREAREALARLYRILDGLAPRHRAAFVLRHIDGLELVDVAAAIGVSLATVKRWLAKISGRVLAQAGRDPVLAPYLREGRGSALTDG